jgi:hypothetical protein
MRKHCNHDHYWIGRCELHESYQTIRGLRFRFISEILLPDNDRLSDEDIVKVEKILAGDDRI